jgi:hypothetical protein
MIEGRGTDAPESNALRFEPKVRHRSYSPTAENFEHSSTSGTTWYYVMTFRARNLFFFASMFVFATQNSKVANAMEIIQINCSLSIATGGHLQVIPCYDCSNVLFD